MCTQHTTCIHNAMWHNQLSLRFIITMNTHLPHHAVYFYGLVHQWNLVTVLYQFSGFQTYRIRILLSHSSFLFGSDSKLYSLLRQKVLYEINYTYNFPPVNIVGAGPRAIFICKHPSKGSLDKIMDPDLDSAKRILWIQHPHVSYIPLFCHTVMSPILPLSSFTIIYII